MFAFEHQRQFSGRSAWMLASGGVDMILAGIVIFSPPGTAAWTMGLLIEINMIVGGASLIAMGTAPAQPNRPGLLAGRTPGADRGAPN